MLYLATGTPGAKKTVFVVSKLDKVERDNKVNLVKNKLYYEANQPFIEKYRSDFGYYEFESGSGHLLRNEIDVLPDDYFDMFKEDFDDLRPDDYFARSTRFNEICERILEREGDTSFKYLLPVRTIYTNIKSLKIDYVRSMEYDWRDCPDGSIVVVDEVQLVEPYKNIKEKNEPIIQELTIHRHRGFDFYFITQYPSLLHPTIKDLIGVHYHLTVPYGLKTKVYQFGSTRAYPNTMANKFNCENKFYFTPNPRLFKLYKSTTINTHQKRIPYKQLLGFAFLVVAALSIFIYGLSGAKNSELLGGDGQPIEDIQDEPLSDSKVPSSSDPSAESLQAEQIKEVNTNNNSGYFNPATGGYIEDINLVPVSFMALGDKCSAYNKFGALLVHISNDQCNIYKTQKGLLHTFDTPKTTVQQPKASTPQNVHVNPKQQQLVETPPSTVNVF